MKIKYKNILSLKLILLTLFFCKYLSITNIKLLAKNNSSDIENNYSNPINSFGSEYLLGPGDQLIIKILGLPELSAGYGIGPDGMIYLPSINGFSANLLTLKEFKTKLIKEYSKILKDPSIFVQLGKVRPVRTYVKGEVKLPGLYILNADIQNLTLNSPVGQNNNISSSSSVQSNLLFPTVYDALKQAKGITPYSDLSKVRILRQNSKSNGGGIIKTELNFISLFIDGDQSQNIRIFDGDTIIIPKSDQTIFKQLIEVNQSDLNPTKVSVFISGKVPASGFLALPRGSGLTQAIAMAGGKQLISGKIEFIRFNDKGETDRRVFNFDQNSKLDSSKNPILMDGDVINVKESIFGATTIVLNKILAPLSPILFIEALLKR